MKYNILISILAIVCFSCKPRPDKLSSYYKDNIQLHSDISEELISFCKTWKCEVTIRQSYESGNIVFEYHINRNPEFELIRFDSLFQRSEPNPGRTSGAIVSLELLKNFRTSIYHSILADSSEVFFSYKYTGEKDIQIGILVSERGKKINPDRIIKKLSDDAYITERVIP